MELDAGARHGGGGVMRSGWEISEADAEAREREIVQRLTGIAQRCVDPQMSDDVIRFKLAARGVSAAELRLMWGAYEKLQAKGAQR